jgi:hypothetical protein
MEEEIIREARNLSNYQIIKKGNIYLAVGIGGKLEQTKLFCYFRYENKEFFGVTPNYHKNIAFNHSDIAIVGARILNIPLNEINNPIMWNKIYFGSQLPTLLKKIFWKSSYFDGKEPPKRVQLIFDKIVKTKFPSNIKRPLKRSKPISRKRIVHKLR